MEKNLKKIKLPAWLTYVLIGAEVLLMAGLVTLSIIAMNAVGSTSTDPFMLWVKENLILSSVKGFFLLVFPLILLFLFNAYLLVKAFLDVKPKTVDTAGMTEEQIREEAKRQAREELMKEMENNKDPK